MERLTIKKYSVFAIVYMISIFISYKMMLSYGLDYSKDKVLMMIIAIMFILFSFNIVYYTKKEERLDRKKMVFNYTFLLVIVLLQLFLTENARMLYYDLCILLLLDILIYFIDRKNVIEKFLKKDAKYFGYYVSIQLVLVLLIIPYGLIFSFDLKTVDEAKEILSNNGYENIEFIEVMERDSKINMELKTEYNVDARIQKDDLLGYFFTAKKNDEKEVILMDLKGGKVLHHSSIK